jgi:hypothetical protein
LCFTEAREKVLISRTWKVDRFEMKWQASVTNEILNEKADESSSTNCQKNSKHKDIFFFHVTRIYSQCVTVMIASSDNLEETEEPIFVIEKGLELARGQEWSIFFDKSAACVRVYADPVTESVVTPVMEFLNFGKLIVASM